MSDALNEVTPTAYEVLGVTPLASDTEIKTAYRLLAQRFHPDRLAAAADPSADGPEQMRVLNVAYEALKTPARRATYDRGMTSDATTSGAKDRCDETTTTPASPPPHHTPCERCGRWPTVRVTVRRQTGLLLLSRTARTDADLCRPCGLRVFRDYTSRTLWSGWWGVFSFFRSLWTLVVNGLARAELASLTRGPAERAVAGRTLWLRPTSYLGPLVLAVAIVAIAQGPAPNDGDLVVGRCYSYDDALQAVQQWGCDDPNAEFVVSSIGVLGTKCPGASLSRATNVFCYEPIKRRAAKAAPPLVAPIDSEVYDPSWRDCWLVQIASTRAADADVAWLAAAGVVPGAELYVLDHDDYPDRIASNAKLLALAAPTSERAMQLRDAARAAGVADAALRHPPRAVCDAMDKYSPA